MISCVPRHYQDYHLNLSYLNPRGICAVTSRSESGLRRLRDSHLKQRLGSKQGYLKKGIDIPYGDWGLGFWVEVPYKPMEYK